MQELLPQVFAVVREAAKRARVSVSMIYQLCDEKRIAHYRVGGEGRRGKILISPSDLDRFLEENRIEAK